MTDQLNRIEALIEPNPNSQQIQDLIKTQRRLAQNMERLTSIQLRQAEQMERLTNTQSRQIDQVEQLTTIQSQQVRLLAGLSDNLASINAAVERLDRIVDYLIRRDAQRDK